MASSDDELPVLMRIQKKQEKKEAEFTFNDLKRFSDKADHVQRHLNNCEAIQRSTCDGDDFREDMKLVEEGMEMADKTIALFSSTLGGPYPGEEIIPSEFSLSSNLKSSTQMVVDRGSKSMVESLFNAVGFASSKEELNHAETALRRVLGSMQFKWTPTIDQILAILSTGFGADVSGLLLAPQRNHFKEQASKYSQANFYVSKTAKKESRRFGHAKRKSLDNLDAIVCILACLDWKVDGLDDDDKATWIRLLLGLSLNTESMDRFEFQSSITKCIRSMADEARGSQLEWQQFRYNVEAAIIGDPSAPRHHHNMVQLISHLPIGADEFGELRSSVAVKCISVILDNGRFVFRGGAVAMLSNLFDQAEESPLLSEAYPLNSLLSLVQCAITPTAARSATTEDVNRLADIFDGIKSRRITPGYGSTRVRSFSLLDGKRISYMFSVIVDGQLRPQRPQLELFRMIDTVNASQDDTFDLEDTEDDGGGEENEEPGDEN